MDKYKRLTILGTLCILTAGLLVWFNNRVSPVFAESEVTGTTLPTPRSYVTALPKATQPVLLMEAGNESNAISQPIVQQPQLVKVAVQPIQSAFGLRSGPFSVDAGQINRSNSNFSDYIYNFYNQWLPANDAGGCAAIWGVVPDYTTLPIWLLTPDRPEQLRSKISYYLLAGILIRNKQVDASGCPNGGLLPDNEWVANNCGMTTALQVVLQWQNQFNAVILQVAKDTGVPAQLMKNVFSRESQFWPGVYSNVEEAGLGQLTVNGADTLLMWNTNFYKQFCPQILAPEACSRGYVNLSNGERDMLTGALVRMVNATCPNCEGGVDPKLAEFSVRVFSENMIANCTQVGQIIQNVTKRQPARVSNYSDLWMFTLVNYHAGSGCLTQAISKAYEKNFDLGWDLVASQLPDYCSNAKNYAEEVISMPDIAPIPIVPTSTPTRMPTATPTATPTSTPKP